MTIHELSRRTGISLRNLRRLDALKVLKIDAEDETASAIQFHLARHPTLSVAHFLALLDEPALLGELGRYETRAFAQLATLGDVKSTAAPREVIAYISDAARGDVNAGRILAEWLKSALPAHDVPHAWVAARLLWPLKAGLRDKAAKSLLLALMQARKNMAGFFHKEGKATVYHQFRLTCLSL